MPTRHTISWSDLRGRRVGVWGLGVEGRANLRRLAREGVEPAVLVDDDPAAGSGGPGLPAPLMRTGDGGLDALLGCEVVVKTPGISRHAAPARRLAAAGVAVVGGLGLWLEELDPAGRERVVLVTGTKGKSTTTSILGHLLRGLGVECGVGGNLGQPPYDQDVEPDVWVVEVSSYQATDLASTTPLVAVTALHPDHLPWHGDVGSYYADKLSLCRLPGHRVTIANGEDARLRAHRDLLADEVVWVTAPGGRPAWVAELGLLGRHNVTNSMIARACLERLGVSSTDDALARAAAGFRGLDSRLQPVGRIAGVEFVDDSLSTNVLPTVAALEAFAGRPVALLAGGEDRGVDYAALAEALHARTAPTLLVALPSNGPRIRAALGTVAPPLEATAAADLPAAVAAAYRWARPRAGVVLLSPAAPSFDHFRDYRHRAEVFRAAIRELGAHG